MAEYEVPHIGALEFKGEITDERLTEVIDGALLPNQGYVKALARQVKILRAQLAAQK